MTCTDTAHVWSAPFTGEPQPCQCGEQFVRAEHSGRFLRLSYRRTKDGEPLPIGTLK